MCNGKCNCGRNPAEDETLTVFDLSTEMKDPKVDTTDVKSED